MSKIAIVTDSTAFFTPEEKSHYQIELVPINVMFEDKVYRDGLDLTPAQAYQFLEQNPKDWATSAPAVGEFLAAFRKYASEGAEAIICLTLAKSISATWNNARMAKEIAKNELPEEVKIEVIDSGTAATGERLLVKKVGEMIKEGKNFAELIQAIEDLKKRLRMFIILETIRYIYRSGRIPEIASKIGAILPLKPILSLHGGKIHFAGAAIHKEKSKNKILGILKREFNKDLPEVDLMYIDDPEETEDFKKKISLEIPEAKISIGEFSPIVGYATGKETIAIAYFGKQIL